MQQESRFHQISLIIVTVTGPSRLPSIVITESSVIIFQVFAPRCTPPSVPSRPMLKNLMRVPKSSPFQQSRLNHPRLIHPNAASVKDLCAPRWVHAHARIVSSSACWRASASARNTSAPQPTLPHSHTLAQSSSWCQSLQQSCARSGILP